MKFKLKNKKAQEELAGFALIIVIVAIVLLVFLGLSIGKTKETNLESEKINNFVNVVLQSTSDCKDEYGYLTIRKLIQKCEENENCIAGQNSCELLETTLEEISESAWLTNTQIKGYELSINSEKNEILLIIQGNKTENSLGSREYIGKSGKLLISFNTYY